MTKGKEKKRREGGEKEGERVDLQEFSEMTPLPELLNRGHIAKTV